MRKNQNVKRLRFSLNIKPHLYPKNCPLKNWLFTAMTPSFCSFTHRKQSLQYSIKTHLSGPPMPKFEANMNYISPSPPSSMKQCNKSATVKFRMELLLQYYDPEEISQCYHDPEAISQWCDTLSLF